MLALFMVVSFLIGPGSRPDANHVISWLLGGNLVWSLALVAASRSRMLVYRLTRIAAALTFVDLAVFTVLLYLTSGADSPYFSPFIVLILGATLQWGSRGAVVMGILTLVAFAPAGWQVLFGQDSGNEAAQAYVLRLGYTAVVIVMLAAFGRHVERVVEELSRLSDPLAESEADAAAPVRDCLRHTLWVFGAERGMFIWDEGDEPYATLMQLDHGRFENRALTPGTEDWVAPEVAESVFLFESQGGTTLVRQGRRTITGPSRPVAASLLEETRFDRALVIPVFTPELSGWLFVFDHEEPANEDLAVGAMVSAQVSVALERWQTQRAQRTAAAAETRIRLARDLHDGVLQFLAGAGLQLDGLVRDGLPAETKARIATLRQAIADEQRELRGFISTLQPTRAVPSTAPERPLAEELRGLADRLARYWTIDVTTDVTPAELKVPDRVSYDLSQIVREAVANAVRHGGARRVETRVKADGAILTIRIADNGKGFAFEGDLGGPDLEQAGGAPRSLHERVRALEGRLRLRSSSDGATLMIDIPLGAA